MSAIVCKGCGAADYVKNGTVRGLQRYRCKACGCNFTMTKARGKPPAMKALAVLLYTMGNMSFCGIGRLLDVSAVSVMKWVRLQAEALPDPETPADIQIVMLDEMHHFLKKRLKNYGVGAPMILCEGELYPGFWVGVMMRPAENFSTKLGAKAASS